jgi:hypothetical protein
VLRLFFLAIIVVLLTGVVLFGLSDTVISSDDAATPNNEAVSNVSKASNSSASAIITITMTEVLDE